MNRLDRNLSAVQTQIAVHLPQAQFTEISEKPWHSATFAGRQLMVKLVLNSADCGLALRHYADQIGEQEFTLCREIVADAELVDMCIHADGAQASGTINMLLIDE